MKRKSKLQRHAAVTAWLFLLPSLAGVAVFVLWLFAETVKRSFQNDPGTAWVGLKNYESVVQNEAFRLAARNTARFLSICVPLLVVFSLLLALLIGWLKKRGNPFKTTALLPMAIPVASICVIWKALFAKNGAINWLLSSFGAKPVDFLGTDAAFWVLIATYLWKNIGYDMILWLAGLDGISKSLYEAAQVDGAGSWQQFRYITLPLLRPTLGIVAVMSLLNGFKVFREAWLVAGTYPHDSIYLLQHLFNNWFRGLDLGRLTAGAVMMAIVLVAVILCFLVLLKRRDQK